MTTRIVHLNVAKGYRGGERQTELLIRELQSADVRQELVARRGAPLARRFTDVDVRVREVRGDFVSSLGATAGADIVHVHEGRSPYSAYLRWLLAGTPYVITRRVPNPIGQHRFAHLAYSKAAVVAAVSPQVGEIVRAFDSRISVQIVPDCTSALPHDPAAANAIRAALPGSVVVGHIGALDLQKGQDLIIEVARRFRHDLANVCFVLVGAGRQEAELRSQAADLPNVVFTGFVENVGDYLAAFDFFVMPSRREGLGSILLDAMEYGLPIVATRVGGIPSIIRDGENGMLIESGGAAPLESALRKLIGDTALQAALGTAGRELAAHYTARIMAETYMSIYRNALGETAALGEF